MVGNGHAGVCHSCQQDILKQDFEDLIYCASCTTVWESKYLKHKKVAAYESMGMPCHACGKGELTQQWANIINCNTCGTAWRSYKLKGFSKRARLKNELAMSG